MHVILGNSITHKAKIIQNWLLAHPNVHVHFTLASGSWLNPVESWFSLLSRNRLKQANFTSKDGLKQAITAFIAQTDEAPKPFMWTRSADDILANIKRFCERHLPRATSQPSSESDH